MSDHLAHKRDRSAPWAAGARTSRASPRRSTVASGWAGRLCHQARLRVGPAVHRQRDQVRAVLDVADDDAAGPASAAAGRRQAQRAPAARLRAPQTQAATGDLADRGGSTRRDG
jgi:hypothetical protein